MGPATELWGMGLCWGVHQWQGLSNGCANPCAAATCPAAGGASGALQSGPGPVLRQ